MAIVTLSVLTAVVFWATEVLPGDAVGVVSGPDATEAEREAVSERLGLDRPAVERYGTWIMGVLHGDLGASLVSGRDVAAIVASRFGATLAVIVPASVLILVLGGVLGTLAGLHAGSRLDRALTASVLGLIAVPDFLIATALLIVLSVWLSVFPAVALVPIGENLWQHPELIALPCIALTLGGFGSSMRLLRASVSQVVRSPYAEFARLNGVSGFAFTRLIVANAAAPAVHAFTIMIAGLLGGAIVIETLFNVPGMGSELTQAVANRDVPLIQGLGLVLGAVTLTVLLAGDIASHVLSGRVARKEVAL